MKSRSMRRRGRGSGTYHGSAGMGGASCAASRLPPLRALGKAGATMADIVRNVKGKERFLSGTGGVLARRAEDGAPTAQAVGTRAECG